MSLSSQKSMQSYLERHEIGKLFEDMMAKLIKEMPNEPISYLIKLLQRVHQRRIGGSVGENTYPSAILYKSGMGLTGSSIPLKHTKDPQIVLPGSKPVSSVWMESSGKEDSATANGNEPDNLSRVYEKPWLAGSKQTKSLKDKKESGMSKTETPSWNTDLKSAKSVDDLLLDQKLVDGRKNMVSKSMSSMKDSRPTKKVRDRNWSDEPRIEEKENNAPHPALGNYCLTPNLDKKSSSILDDELKIESRPPSASKKTICSPQTYSKFKRKLSKKKSFENKEKLQALLSTDQSPKSPKDDDVDSSDYDGDEVFEDSNELLVEGARSKISNGKKHSYKSSSDNIKVSVCSRCAQIMGDSNLQSPPPLEESLNMSDDNENFSSVSQLDSTKSYKPVWSPITTSKTKDLLKMDKLLKSKSPKKGILQKSKFDNNNRMSEEDKSDFFEKNNPLRNKTKRFVGDFMSDNDSDFNEDGNKIVLPSTKAWQQQLDDTGSEGDVDEDPQVLDMKGRGWKQKIAMSNVDTEI